MTNSKSEYIAYRIEKSSEALKDAKLWRQMIAGICV